MSETRKQLLAWASARIETAEIRAAMATMPDADLRDLVAQLREDERGMQEEGRLAYLWRREDEGGRTAIVFDDAR